MDIYAEIDQRRSERAARRQARMELEARMAFVIEVVVGAIAMYATLFVGCLWAAI